MPFVNAFPEVAKSMSSSFDVDVFDVLHLDETLERLAGRTFDVGIILKENSHLAAIWLSTLETRNSKLHHFVGFAELPTVFNPSQLNDLGLCDCLDSAIKIDDILRRITEIARSCRHHPLTTHTIPPPDSHSSMQAKMDQVVVRLVARGMSDRDISEMLDDSNQSVRNKISRLLADQGLENRTELAAVEFQHTLRRILDQHRSPGRNTDR